MVGLLIHENATTQTRVRERGKREDATKSAEASGILEGLFPVFTRVTVLKVWFGDSWRCPRPSQEALRSELFSK